MEERVTGARVRGRFMGWTGRSTDRERFQAWFVDTGAICLQKMPQFLKRYRRRGSSLHRDHRTERISKPAAVGQRFAPQIFVDESGGKGVAGTAGINDLDFV